MKTPLAWLLFSILGNTAFQLYWREAFWSPFSLLGFDANVAEILKIYLIGAVAFLCGGALGNANRLAGHRGVATLEYEVDRLALENVTKAVTFLLVCFLVATQFALGSANFFSLASGVASARDVEEALAAAPFGLHGLGLLVAFAGVIIWQMNRLVCVGRCSIVLPLVLFMFFVSQGKAQGLLYLSAAFLLTSKRVSWIRLCGVVLVVTLVFFSTRLLRNQDIGLVASLNLLISLALGAYLGSPVLNVAYIWETNLYSAGFGAFFSNFIPHKVLDNGEFWSQLPDPTSPIGVIGAGLLLGGMFPMMLYCILIGMLTTFFWNGARRVLALQVFLPFLMVACVFGMMYNHFANLTFFWLPLLLAMILCRICQAKLKVRYVWSRQ